MATMLAGRGIDIDLREVWSNPQLPGDVDGIDAVVVMGGPASAGSAAGFPTRSAELSLLSAALRRGTPTLGICLGAQLLAVASGGRVFSGRAGPEIGWAPVSLSEAARDDPLFAGVIADPVVLHWHGDTYERGPGVVGLGSSSLYKEQAFRAGPSAWGLQFHLEVDEDAVSTFVDAFPEDGAAAIGGRDGLRTMTTAAVADLAPVREKVLGRFADLVVDPSHDARSSLAPGASGSIA